MKRLLESMLLCAALVLPQTIQAQKWEELGRTPQMGWNSWNAFGRFGTILTPYGTISISDRKLERPDNFNNLTEAKQKEIREYYATVEKYLRFDINKLTDDEREQIKEQIKEQTGRDKGIIPDLAICFRPFVD